MKLLFGNKRTLALVLSALFLVLTVTTGAVAALSGSIQSTPPRQEEPSSSYEDPDEDFEDEEPWEDEEPLGASPLQVQLPREIIEATPTSYNRPASMKAVYLLPGTDFYKGARTSDSDVKADIDKAVADAKKLGMNTLIVQSRMDKLVIYKRGIFPSLPTGFDVLDYIIDKARENGMYLYMLYGASDIASGGAVVQASATDVSAVDIASRNIKELANNYNLDGVILEDYYNEQKESSYSDYLQNGSGQGLQAYLREASYARFSALVTTARLNSRSLQIGMLADPVWENKSADEFGSATAASFTALSGGNTDTRRFVEDGLVDFVMVKAFGSLTDKAAPFEKVVAWWNSLYQIYGTHMYAVHAADKACTDATGWASPDQLTKQLIALKAMAGFRGSAFNSLPHLLADPQGSTTTLVAFLSDKIKSDHIMTKLAITKPEKTEYETMEPVVIFSGASDPNFPVTLDGKDVEQDDNGYFSISKDLKSGLNTFVFKHKDQTITYKIKRNVQILKEISPTGSINIDGEMQLTISALAYADADVSAVINGKTVTMKEETAVDETIDKDSAYVRYTGTYTAPAAISSVQSLGNIVVKGEWQGASESKTGANVKVNKKAEIGSGEYVQINAASAETFPSNTLDDLSNNNCFPLPKGTIDQILGDPIAYKEGNTTYEYYMLQSGQRVYSKDVRRMGKDETLGDNSIKGLTVQSDSRYTKVILNTLQNVPYKVSYSSGGIKFNFAYTSSVPGNLTLTKNPLFKSAKWSGSTLTLEFKNNGFLGYRAYYESGNLVLRFNNSPGGVSGARIVIDPGHGVSDPGALGFYQGKDEREINLAIAKQLESILKSRGASVNRLATEKSKVLLADRMQQARNYEPHIFVSIHANSAASSTARGTEAYYFYDFSRRYAEAVSSRVSSALGTTNRGDKFGYFYVTRESEFLTTLAETGFVSNKDEYTKLLDPDYQSDIATALANTIESILSSYSTSGSGTESVGSTGQKLVTSVKLDKTTLELAVGAKQKLVATLEPADATNKEIKWETADAAIATVSADGEITALKAGKVKIKAISQSDTSKTAECEVTVVIPVTGVTLNKTTLELAVGGKEQLTATIAPAEATNKTIKWETADAAIATVSATGEVTAIKAGTVKIRAVSEADATKLAECTVTVKSAAVAVTGVKLDKTALTLAEGDKGILTATVEPTGATNKTIKWETTDATIATVSATGEVTAVKEGTVKIRAVSEADSTKFAECTVTVKSAAVAVTGVTLDGTEITLKVGETYTFTLTVSPENATDKSVTWTSSAADIAGVSGGTVTALKVGFADITVTANDSSGKNAVCRIIVEAADTGEGGDPASSVPEPNQE